MCTENEIKKHGKHNSERVVHRAFHDQVVEKLRAELERAKAENERLKSMPYVMSVIRERDAMVKEAKRGCVETDVCKFYPDTCCAVTDRILAAGEAAKKGA